MTTLRKTILYGTVSVWGVTVMLAGSLQAQSDTALIDKLVQKGILTEQEAVDLRKEAEHEFSKDFSSRTGMPDWVNKFKLYGDVRVRYEEIDSPAKVFDAGDSTITPPRAPGLKDFPGRTRFRYRLRFGATVTMLDNLEAGLRLTSGETANGGSGGNPLSGNSAFKDNGSKKFLFVDLAYGKWYFPKNSPLSGNLTLGKMENPFVFSDMIFDPDYTPEGAAVQAAYKIADNHTLKLSGGGFVFDENSVPWINNGGVGHNAFMAGVQLRYDVAWTKKLSTSLGAAWLTIQNGTNLTTASVPDQNVGNTRNRFSNGAQLFDVLIYDYQPYILDGAVTYTLDHFPLYRGSFPVKISGEYLNNPEAPYHADNYAWDFGVVLGKSGKRGTWDFSYTYRWLGANAWYEELVDDDFGAVYQNITVPPGPGVFGVAGYYTGTNVKGHVLRFSYSPADALTLSFKCFLTEIIRPIPQNSVSEAHRFQVDAMLKF